MALVVSFFVILLFPLYIINILCGKNLYTEECMDKYGTLYANFKTNKIHNKFMIIILIKQLLYAIAINISEQLTLGQNIFLLVINLVFVIFLMMYKPYTKSLFQIQAVVMSSSMIVITIINFIFILEDTDSKLLETFTVLSAIIHIISFVAFFIIQLIGFIKNKRKAILERIKFKDGIVMTGKGINRSIDSNNSLASMQPINPTRNPHYEKHKTRRFSQEINKNKIYT